MSTRVAFIGFGEAGGLLGAGLVQRGAQVTAYDLLFDAPAQREMMLAKAQTASVRAAVSLAEALNGVQLVFSAVTASSASAAAAAAASCLQPGQIFVDLNSVSPESKRGNCAIVEASGATYVEAAVMAPVPLYGLAVPMLLGGAQAEAAAKLLSSLGLTARAVAGEVGVVSAIKMCRSVMIKGLEALTWECLSAARRYGAEQAVLASLSDTFPGMGWTGKLPHYLISRVAEHGRRRAAEMREVAQTLAAVGISPDMSRATVRVQARLAAAMCTKGVAYPRGREFVWQELVDDVNR